MKHTFRILAILAITSAMILTSCSKGESTKTASQEAGETKEATTKATATTPVQSAKVKITFLNSKGEIQTALEETAKEYQAETGVEVEIIACGAGDVPYTKITTMYNSGNAPTMAMLDTLDVVSLAEEYALDLSGEKWTAECANQLKRIGGKVYSFPFCIEGRGIIYNKKIIEETLKHSFDPDSIKSLDQFKSLLSELKAGGLESPVFLAKEDWSLGAHQLGFIYDAYDGTSEGAAKIIKELEEGLDPVSYNRFNQFVDTIDTLLSYSIDKADPLGANYDLGALELAEGEVAFWPNGCWAWPNLVEGGAQKTDAYGFLPFFLGNDETDFANNGIQAAPSKQVMIDRIQASPEQIQAAKDFLSWLVYDKNGQKALVEKCALIPACGNNSYAPLDPLGQDIVKKMSQGKAYSSSFIAPSDHWSVMGAACQKYISGAADKAELASTLSSYWKSQNK